MENTKLGAENLQDECGILCPTRRQGSYQGLGLRREPTWRGSHGTNDGDSLIISKNEVAVDWNLQIHEFIIMITKKKRNVSLLLDARELMYSFKIQKIRRKNETVVLNKGKLLFYKRCFTPANVWRRDDWISVSQFYSSSWINGYKIQTVIYQWLPMSQKEGQSDIMHFLLEIFIATN